MNQKVDFRLYGRHLKKIDMTSAIVHPITKKFRQMQNGIQNTRVSMETGSRIPI